MPSARCPVPSALASARRHHAAEDERARPPRDALAEEVSHSCQPFLTAWGRGEGRLDPRLLTECKLPTWLNRVSSWFCLSRRSQTVRLEPVGPSRRLGLGAELERADMVAAAKRVKAGVEYYDYDFALPALKCGAQS